MKKINSILIVTLFLACINISSSESAKALVNCSQSSATSKAPMSIQAPSASLQTFPSVITLRTNCGDIDIQLDKRAPMTLTSILTLSRGGFYDNTFCHRLTTAGIFVLQCGDPTATGSGGPGWRTIDENLPSGSVSNYPAGTVAMANSGPNTNGSQFFITYKDSTIGPNYSIWGKVISGIEILEYIASKGISGNVTSDGLPAFQIGIISIIERDSNYLTTFNSGVNEGVRLSGQTINSLNKTLESLQLRLETLNSDNDLLKKQLNLVTTALDTQNISLNSLQTKLVSTEKLSKTLEKLNSKLSKQLTLICGYRPKPKGC